MKPMIHLESGTAAQAEVISAHKGNHQTEKERENRTWTEKGKDTEKGTETEVMILKLSGEGNVRKVEVERGTIMRGTKAEKEIEKETEIEDDELNE